MKPCVRTVRKIEYYDVISSGIFADKLRHIGPREWAKQAVLTLEEATELYIIMVIAESFF